MNINSVELIGYLGSILVAISLTMKSLLRLRIINLIGALFFTLYGLLLGAYPVAFLNGIIVCIDLYYLVQMWRRKDFFTFLEVSPNGKYLSAFVEFHRDDIREIIPTYTHHPDDDLLCFFILRNMMPAGLFIAKIQGEEAHILLDYVIPNYRDFQVARFIFEDNAAFFRQRGIRRFVSDGGSPIHRRYLEKMEFVNRGDLYVHEIGKKLLQDSGL
jgi:GGDEF domain-containing protein